MTEGQTFPDPEAQPAASSGTAVPPPGSLIGRFLVVGTLGAGGMGIVLSAYDPGLDRKVAIKLLHPDLFGDGRNLDRLAARLLREAQAMAKISHPNVLPVYDVGTYHGQVFLAMEYVDGGRLTDWLAQKRPWREVLAAFLAAGQGLAAAHALGMVHRDFKPDNVLIGRDGRVRVTDFGVVGLTGAHDAEDVEESGLVSAEPITRTGAVLGTPGYMAPEQLAGGAVDARADQFAFCVALYRAFCGGPPFGAESVVPAPIGTKMPRFLRPLVMRGLARRPEDRHPSLAALLAAIERGPVVTRRRLLVVAGLAALAAGVTVLVRGWPAGPRPPLVSRRLTYEPAENLIEGSALSPDGKLLAFSDAKGLHVLDIDAGTRRDVSLPGQTGPLSWLPDSERVLVQLISPRGVEALYVVSRDGKAIDLGVDGDCPAVSHAGDQIAFTQDGDLWRTDLAGQNRRLLRKAAPGMSLSGPTWSPDDHRLAYTQDEASIWTVAVDGGDARMLAGDRALGPFFGMCHPMPWLGDGRIFYTTRTHRARSGSELWTIRADGSGAPERSEAFLDQTVSLLSASADGRRLAYNLVKISGPVEVGDLGPGTGALTNLRRVGSDEGDGLPLRFSADGKSLLALENRAEHVALARYALDGSRLTETVLKSAVPQVSLSGALLHPGGSRVLFFARQANPGAREGMETWRLSSLPIDGGPTGSRDFDISEGMRPSLSCARPPSTTCVLAVFPWGPSSRGRVGEATVQRFDPDLGGEGELLRLPVDKDVVAVGQAVSPSGELLAVSEFGPSVKLIQVNGGGIRLIPFPGLRVQSITFGLDDATLYFTAMSAGSGDDYILARATLDGTFEVLRSSKFEWMSSPTVSNDGRHLAFFVRSFDTDIWMIEKP